MNEWLTDWVIVSGRLFCCFVTRYRCAFLLNFNVREWINLVLTYMLCYAMLWSMLWVEEWGCVETRDGRSLVSPCRITSFLFLRGSFEPFLLLGVRVREYSFMACALKDPPSFPTLFFIRDWDWMTQYYFVYVIESTSWIDSSCQSVCSVRPNGAWGPCLTPTQ